MVRFMDLVLTTSGIADQRRRKISDQKKEVQALKARFEAGQDEESLVLDIHGQVALPILPILYCRAF